MGLFKKWKFWKRKASGSPTKVDKCVSAEGPRTRDIGTMTEGVTSGVDTSEYDTSSAGCAEWYGSSGVDTYEHDASSAGCAEWHGAYEDDAPSTYYAEWGEGYEYAAPSAYYEELYESYAYDAQSACYAEMCRWYAYDRPAVNTRLPFQSRNSPF
jgi:hypothetical protein